MLKKIAITALATALLAGCMTNQNQKKETITVVEGMAIPCKTMNTLKRSNPDTPIVALTTVPIIHENKLFIPAETEVHGSIKTTIPGKIISNEDWIIVFRHENRSIKITGKALFKDFTAGIKTQSSRNGEIVPPGTQFWLYTTSKLTAPEAKPVPARPEDPNKSKLQKYIEELESLVENLETAETDEQKQKINLKINEIKTKIQKLEKTNKKEAQK